MTCSLGSCLEKVTMDAIFITRIVQERFLAKKKDLYFTFVGLEKAFDRVPQQVVTWALRKVGLEEWIIRVVKAMYENAKSAININGTTGDPFPVKVGVHQGSVLSPLFIIVLKAISREFSTGLHWELLYADDLVLMADSIEELEILFERWKSGMEQKGIRVNSGKTEVMISKHKRNPQNKTGKFPGSVCLKGVVRNSILCPACKCWVHAKCSGLKGQLVKATNFVCSQCSSGAVADRTNEEKVMLAGSNLEVVDKFCYLGDMLDAGGRAESSTVTRVRSRWEKFRELLPLLTTKAISLKVKGELYASCVRRVMLYGSETWPIKVEESQRLHHNEMSMIRWMRGVIMRDRYPCEELRARVGIKPIVDVMRQRRLRWFVHIERREDNSWLKKV